MHLVVAAVLVCAAEPDQAKLAAVGPAMQKYVDNRTVAGVVTVVGSSKGVARTDAVGQRTLDPAAPMTKGALFRIASMTKPITAAGVMILADEGKLDPSDPVEKYLPEFKGQMVVAARGEEVIALKRPKRPITLRDLMTHTSGLPNYPAGLEDLYAKRNRTLAESILAVSQRPLDFEPGTRWAYCNPGIDALGRVVEVVSGQSYESFLQQRIFGPLGMNDTTFTPNKEQAARVAGLYGEKDGNLVRASRPVIGEPTKSRHPIPAGGLYSTGADVARFYQMMLCGGTLDGKKVLSEQSVRTMTQVQTGELKAGLGANTGFGYGFAVLRKPEEGLGNMSAGTFGHGGAFGTQSWADPRKDVFAVLLIQRVGIKPTDGVAMQRVLMRLAVEAAAR